MAMDLTEICEHCGAGVGNFCLPDCSVNGKKILSLMRALKSLGLNMSDIDLSKYRRDMISRYTTRYSYRGDDIIEGQDTW